MFRPLIHPCIAGSLALLLTGCAAIAVKGDKEIFLHGTEAELSAAKFYLDGKPVDWSMHEYSATEVSRTSTTTTYSVTSLPAIHVPSEQSYYTLTVENASGQRRSLLLKRDIISGYKWILYGDLCLALGIGTVVDTYTDNLFGWPQIEMKDFDWPSRLGYEIGPHHEN